MQCQGGQVVLGRRNTGLRGALKALGSLRQVAHRAQTLRVQQAQVEGGAGVTLVGSLAVNHDLTGIVGLGLQALGLQQA